MFFSTNILTGSVSSYGAALAVNAVLAETPSIFVELDMSDTIVQFVVNGSQSAQVIRSSLFSYHVGSIFRNHNHGFALIFLLGRRSGGVIVSSGEDAAHR